jgi:hypothetical protein
MKGDARSLFLDRVRHAAERGKAYRVHLHPVPPDAGYVGGRGDDLCAAMAAEVNNVGGYAHLVADLDEARATVSSLLHEYGARTVLAWKHDLLTRRLGCSTTRCSRRSIQGRAARRLWG